MSQNPDGMRQKGLYHWTLVMDCWWSWGCARMRHHAERACCPVTLATRCSVAACVIGLRIFPLLFDPLCACRWVGPIRIDD